jgi:hypothetical protein
MGYIFERDKDGRRTGRIIQQKPDKPDSAPLQFRAPAGTTAPGAPKTKIKCKLCGKKYAHKGIMANHFRKSHQDHYEDKNSWRDWFEEVVE